MPIKAPTIQEAIDAYVSELQASHPATTAQTYASGLAALGRYLTDCRIDPKKKPAAELPPDVLVRYPSWLTTDHFGNAMEVNPYSRATYLAVVAAWLRYLVREKLSPAIASDMERIRQAFMEGRPRGSRLPRSVRDRVVEKILDVIENDLRKSRGQRRIAAYRDRALVQTLRSTGARISELLGADVESLEGKLRALRVTGKGRKERLVYFDGPAWVTLREYLDMRHVLRLTGRGKTTPLFARLSRLPHPHLKSITPHAARKMLGRYIRKANIDEKVTPHRFRHYAEVRIMPSNRVVGRFPIGRGERAQVSYSA